MTSVYHGTSPYWDILGEEASLIFKESHQMR
jgi:hypothetical protein